MERAGGISNKFGEGRVVAYTSQLNHRYQAVTTNTKQWLDKFQQSYTDHVTYRTKYKSCADWLEATQAELDQCKRLGADKSDVQTKLTTVKVWSLL